MKIFSILGILFSAFWVVASTLLFNGSALESLYLYWLEAYAYGLSCLLVSFVLCLVGPWRQKDSRDRVVTLLIAPFALPIYSLFSLIPLLALSFFDMMARAWAQGGVRADTDPRTTWEALDAIWQSFSDPDKFLYPALFIIGGAMAQTINEAFRMAKAGQRPTDLVGKAILTGLVGHMATLAMAVPIIISIALFHSLLPIFFAIVGLRVLIDLKLEQKKSKGWHQTAVTPIIP